MNKKTPLGERLSYAQIDADLLAREADERAELLRGAGG